MIRVDESDPVGEVALSFPYRDVQIRRNVDPKQLYELQTEIGRGKFGTVYKCREKETGLNLAAKFVSVPKKEDRRNVEREVDIMRSLQHPRLLQIYDAFENGKNMCVILELIEGGELFERVIDDDFVLTEKSCTVFMRQICEGVDFIHKQRIIHLDMKPENILCLTRTGNRIKIIDFGLARRYDPDKKLQVLFGTPEFVAPEVVNFDQIGYGTDMWSVGVICYVLLSGLSPFMGSTDVETMANVTVAKYDFEDEAFQNISENAKDFIAKLLLKDMHKRMTAEQCLNHVWLKRQIPPETPNMEVTKDNLRQFVERWNDHPNSPYIFELSSHIISPPSSRLQLSNSQHSLVGLSPSPCGSLASSTESDDAFPHSLDKTNNLMPPSLDNIRRSSDSSYITKGTDIVERVNLADEIRKLTDKLFELSSLPSLNIVNNTNESQDFQSSVAEIKINNSSSNSSAVSRSKPIEIIRPKNNYFLNDTNNVDMGVPWRRQKFRITNTSRDVPLAPKTPVESFSKHLNSQISSFHSTISYSSRESDRMDGNKSTIESTAYGTKNMLLKLLEQWDGPQTPSRLGSRHGSVSSDWTENDSLGQKTISSLNSFFQSRAAVKKTHPFLKTNGVN